MAGYDWRLAGLQIMGLKTPITRVSRFTLALGSNLVERVQYECHEGIDKPIATIVNGFQCLIAQMIIDMCVVSGERGSCTRDSSHAAVFRRGPNDS